MDDSVTNNLFNNPITGGDKNDDFLAAEIATPALASETVHSREERPAGRPESREYRIKAAQKAERGVRRRHETGDQTTAKVVRELHSTRGELADITQKDEAGERIQQEIQEAKKAGRIIEGLAKFTAKFRERGGEALVKNVLPVVGMLSVAALSLYLQRTGTGMAELAAYIPEVTGGMIAAGNEENQVLRPAVEKRGYEAERIKWLPAAERFLGAASGMIAHSAGEASSTFGASEMVMGFVGGTEHLVNKYVEGPILKGIKKIKERRAPPSSETQRHSSSSEAAAATPRDG